MQLRRTALLAVVALMAVACGGGDDRGDADGVAAPEPSSTTTVTMAAPAPEVEVPDIALTDVGSGEEVSLASLIPSERPVLFWFWAPH